MPKLAIFSEPATPVTSGVIGKDEVSHPVEIGGGT
jgi:hypothetical protein